MLHANSLAAARLEFFLERPDVELVAPRALVLMSQIPERIGNRRRLEQVFVLRVREKFPEQRHVDSTVNIYICDVDALRMKIARHYFCEPSHRKLSWCECRRGRPWPDARGRAGDQNRTSAPR